MNEVRIVVRVDIDELVERIEDDLDHDQLFEFVKKLDETVQDWDFTHRLIKHFGSLMDLYNKEVVTKIEQPKEQSDDAR